MEESLVLAVASACPLASFSDTHCEHTFPEDADERGSDTGPNLMSIGGAPAAIIR
jgi:hypothetical protein